MWKSRVLKHTVHVANGKNFKETAGSAEKRHEARL
jgi:hypothetical protein